MTDTVPQKAINVIELEVLNDEILIRMLIEQTKAPGNSTITWDKIDGTNYQSKMVEIDTVWDLFLTKTLTTGAGSGYQYSLEIMRDNILNNSIKETPVLTQGQNTSSSSLRSTGVKELYIIVEKIVLDEKELKTKDISKLIFNLANCRND